MLTRRSWILGLTNSLGLACGPRGRLAAAAVPDGADFPVTGDLGSGLGRFDEFARRVMAREAIPGASLAIAHVGKLVLARGYGWANVADHEPAMPTTLFALASVSKSLTAATVLKLVEAQRLALEARAFADLLPGLRPLPGDRVDPRIGAITVRQRIASGGNSIARPSRD
jgi:CubicO group peptidase (beta-lactamase class C family)